MPYMGIGYILNVFLISLPIIQVQRDIVWSDTSPKRMIDRNH